jgi:1-acyl-sn-glycerol-3-phosphate acyltransferase
VVTGTGVMQPGGMALATIPNAAAPVSTQRRVRVVYNAATAGRHRQTQQTAAQHPERMHPTTFMQRPVPEAVSWALTRFTRLITGAQARWLGCAPVPVQRIYFGNHNSHADFALIWASLPAALRRMTRPVAGADYWNASPLRRYIIHEVLHGVVIERSREGGAAEPVDIMAAALEAGDSLILFPEGTRNTTDDLLLPIKSGIYHLAQKCPQIDLVPVWMDNLGRLLPKGEIVPVPLLCSISFGTPMRLQEGEDKDVFLARIRDALLTTMAAARPAEQ